MNWGTVGRWVLLLGSLALGIIAGWVGYWIFQGKVPAAMQTSVLATEAKVYYIGSGVGLGLAIFAWTMVAVAIAGRAAKSRARRDIPKP
jgi:hypothetical protein